MAGAAAPRHGPPYKGAERVVPASRFLYPSRSGHASHHEPMMVSNRSGNACYHACRPETDGHATVACP